MRRARNPCPLTEGYGFRAPSLRSGPGMTQTSGRVSVLRALRRRIESQKFAGRFPRLLLQGLRCLRTGNAQQQLKQQIAPQQRDEIDGHRGGGAGAEETVRLRLCQRLRQRRPARPPPDLIEQPRHLGRIARFRDGEPINGLYGRIAYAAQERRAESGERRRKRPAVFWSRKFEWKPHALGADRNGVPQQGSLVLADRID